MFNQTVCLPYRVCNNNNNNNYNNIRVLDLQNKLKIYSEPVEHDQSMVTTESLTIINGIMCVSYVCVCVL